MSTSITGRVLRRYFQTLCSQGWIVTFFLCGLAGIYASPAAAEDDPVPRLVINTQGPAARTTSLAFSRDSKRLYSAGLDKVVHVWEVGWDAEAADAVGKVTYVRPIRWEITRGVKGQIKVIRSCPSRNELVIAGTGARAQIGDIGVIDLGVNEVTASLPTPAERAANSSASGHHHDVWTVDYSPSGNQLLSTDFNERVFLWKRNAIGQWAGRELQPDQGTVVFPAPVLFTDEDKYIIGVRQNGGGYKIEQRSLSNQKAVAFPEIYPQRISAMARSVDGFWATADGEGKVHLTHLQNNRQRFSLRTRFPYIASIDFGPNEILAITSNETIDAATGRGCVELWDAKQRKRLDELIVSEVEKVMAVAISPNGEFLATTNEDQMEIRVFRLKEKDQSKIDRPLSSRSASVASGTSLQIRQVAVSADDKRIGVGLLQGAIQYEVDVDKAEVILDANWTEPIEPVTEDGWNTRVQRNSPFVVPIYRGNELRAVIELDPIRQGDFSDACFIPGAPGSGEPGLIAIATGGTFGVFVYSLPVDNKPPKMLRWFYDHGSKPIDLAAFNDGTRIISGSLDGTVKIWSLDRIYEAGSPSFSKVSHWGAAFGIEQGKVVSRRVNGSGVAYAKGLREGDQVLEVRGYLEDQQGSIISAAAPAQSAAQILDVLEKASVLRQVLISVSDGTKQRSFIIRPAWEPTLTAHINRNGQWAIWHPQGYFNASPAEGGEIFGWQFNRGQDRPPRFLSGDQLQKEFERPDVIRGLLGGLSLERALAAAGDNKQGLEKVVRQVPDVKIVAPTAFTVGPERQETEIVARLRFTGGDQKRYLVSASIDGTRLGTPRTAQQANGDWLYRWTGSLSNRMNQVEVVATENGGALSSLYSSDVVYLRGSGATDKPYRLHILSVASEDYTGDATDGRGGFGPLLYPIDDVSAVKNLLIQSQERGLAKFQFGESFAIQDPDVSRASVEQKIDEMNRILVEKYRDEKNLLIVYLSGHGKTVEGQYYYIVPDVNSLSDAELKAKGIPWSVFRTAGAENCQVLYMIDTCHSGTAVDLKSSIRDPKRSQGIVFAAASGTSAAIELKTLQHGVFSFSVLLGLSGQADNSDGKQDQEVSLTELISFVTEKTISLSSNQQRPAVAPRRLTETLDLPLVRVESQ